MPAFTIRLVWHLFLHPDHGALRKLEQVLGRIKIQNFLGPDATVKVTYVKATRDFKKWPLDGAKPLKTCAIYVFNFIKTTLRWMLPCSSSLFSFSLHAQKYDHPFRVFLIYGPVWNSYLYGSVSFQVACASEVGAGSSGILRWSQGWLHWPSLVYLHVPERCLCRNKMVVPLALFWFELRYLRLKSMTDSNDWIFAIANSLTSRFFENESASLGSMVSTCFNYQWRCCLDVITSEWLCQMCLTMSGLSRAAPVHIVYSMSLMWFACWRDSPVTMTCPRTWVNFNIFHSRLLGTVTVRQYLPNQCYRQFTIVHLHWKQDSDFEFLLFHTALGTCAGFQALLCWKGWSAANHVTSFAASQSAAIHGVLGTCSDPSPQVSEWVNCSFGPLLAGNVSTTPFGTFGKFAMAAIRPHFGPNYKHWTPLSSA